MSEFENLLEDLEKLSKAEEAEELLLQKSEDQGDDAEGDKKIREAAGVDDEGDEDPDPNDVYDDDDDDDDMDDEEAENGEGAKKPMAKAMTGYLDDGSEATFMDAQELIKSMRDAFDRDNAVMAKSMANLEEKIEEQGKILKALGEKVLRIGKAGKGRKSVVSAQMAKSEPQAATAYDILAKCERAMSEGRLSGTELCMAETYLNRGMALPQDIINKL